MIYKPFFSDNPVAFKSDGEWVVGYICDKYTGIVRRKTYISYGGSGTADRTNPINADFYIIKQRNRNKTFHILCSEVFLYDSAIHENGESGESSESNKAENALG
jgi:hypothetical protein